MAVFRSPYPPVPLRDMSITERVFDSLSGRPDEVVLVEGPTGREVTAAALMDQIRRFAGGLSARGYGAGHTVCIMAPNVPEYVTVFHGVAWAGGTISTANPTYTAPELNYQLRDSGAELLVTVPAFLETARAAADGTGIREIVVIGEDEGATSFTEFFGPPIEAQVPIDLDEHVIVLPYSSGTTGLPKGVMLTHRNLVVNVDQGIVAAGIEAGERAVAFLPFFHIYGQTLFINIYLAAGASVVTMPRFDLEQFLNLVQTHRTRRIWAVPPVAIALSKHPLVDRFDLFSVEAVYSAAAPADGTLTDAVAARLGAKGLQAYGMTELSPLSHIVPLQADKPGAAGVAAPSTDCRIVDPGTGRDLGANEEGELWIRGPQVMKGYHNNPEATSATIDGEWLKTGDLAVIDEDGYLFIRDRLKELIKYKGFQVAPAELEAILVTHPAVADAAVIPIQDTEAGELPKGFVVLREGAQASAEELMDHVASHVASYKRVREVEFIDEIPKSLSGKILRRVLRDREARRA